MPAGEMDRIQEAFDATMLAWLRKKIDDPEATLKLIGVKKQGKYDALVTYKGRPKHFTLKIRGKRREEFVDCIAKFLEKIVFHYNQTSSISEAPAKISA